MGSEAPAATLTRSDRDEPGLRSFFSRVSQRSLFGIRRAAPLGAGLLGSAVEDLGGLALRRRGRHPEGHPPFLFGCYGVCADGFDPPSVSRTRAAGFPAAKSGDQRSAGAHGTAQHPQSRFHPKADLVLET